MKLNLDKQPKFRFAVLSIRQDKASQVELESSFDREWEARSMFERQYSKWGFTDTNFYLVDWKLQSVMVEHEVFQNEYSRILHKGE